MSDVYPANLAEGVETFHYFSNGGHPCACHGGINCCVRQAERGAAYHDAAHIVARQLWDYRNWRFFAERGDVWDIEDVD